MRFLLISFFLISTIITPAQSRRVSPTATPTVPVAAAALTVKQMYDEVSRFRQERVAEYERKKVPYSERLRLEMERERKQLAAKYATVAASRTDLTDGDVYSVAMLH